MRYLLGRRVAAGLCAVALMAALVAFPVRAKAAAAGAILPAVSGAVAVTAFLNVCGIYPFQDESGQSFGEWGARKLTELWDTYITEVYPQSEAAQTINDVKAFYANGGYLTMARDTWDSLRGFAGWVVNKYGLASNTTDCELGESVLSGFAKMPVVYSSAPSSPELVSSGIHAGYSALNNCDVYFGASANGAGGYYWAYYLQTYVHPSLGSGNRKEYPSVVICSKLSSGLDLRLYFVLNFSSSPDFNDSGISYDYSRAFYRTWTNIPFYQSSVVSGVPVYATLNDALDAFVGATPTLKGITADMGAEITIPAELPEGAELGGLAVAGAEVGVDALEDVIETGVMERQKPTVRPVEVEIGEGMEVDAGTGAVAAETPSVITITPESVPLSVSDYAVPGLHTLFPFSVPWDIARVWQALDAEPRWFLEDVVLTLPAQELWGEEPLVVRFRMEDMPQQIQAAVQSLAATVRAFLLIIACIGFLIFAVGFIKF